MDPLMIAGRIGELVDPFLRDGQPVADGDLLAAHALEVGEAGDFDGFHMGIGIS